MKRIITICVLLAAGRGSLGSQDSITLVQPTTGLTVDSGSKSSSGMLYLRNAGSKASKIALSVGQFINRTSEKGINAKTTLFGPNDSTGSQVLRIDIPAQDVAHVRLEASNRRR